MPLISIIGAEVDVLRGPRGLAGADGGSGGGDPPDIPSKAEAEAGSDNTKMMTPLRTAESVAIRLLPYQTISQLQASILFYLTAAELWIPDVTQADQMLSGDATNGMAFRAELITGPINRSVWTPRTASVPAIDITPKGASPVAIGGRLGWHEFCSSDFLGAASGDPFHSMRLSVDDPAVLGRGGSIGTHVFNGETIGQPWELMISGVSGGRFSDPQGTLYTKGGGKSGTFTIADDAVQAIEVPVAGDPKYAILAIQRNAPGMAGLLRVKAGTAATTPVEIVMITGSVTVNYTTGIPTGTSGINGNITITTHTDGFLYIENRAGAPISIGTYWMPQGP